MNPAQKIEPTDWIRSPVDVQLARKAVSVARRALMAHDKEATPREIIFTLMSEAVQTERAIRTPGPRGHVSCMPEVYHTNGEIFATEVAMIQDKISYTPHIKPVVTADAASRYLEVTKWLRFVQGKNRAESKELVWLAAKGYNNWALAKKFRYPNADAASAALRRRLNEIAKHLSQEKVFD